MLKFDLARNALRYLIREYKIKEIYIPYYLCSVIRHAVFAEECRPIFYHIDNHFMPEGNLPGKSYILYPNYFGICDKNIDILIEKYDRLIVDNAHAFYAQPRGFASINSKKKFIPDCKEAYLFYGNEHWDIIPDKNRREIFERYHKIYGKSNLLNIDIPKEAVPFCYPYLAPSIENADMLVRKLSSGGVIIFRYWNPLPKSYNEYKFYSRLVPIPLDSYQGKKSSLPVRREDYKNVPFY